MTGKAAMKIIAGHALLLTNIAAAIAAQVAFTAGQYGWNHNGFPDQIRRTVNHGTADLVAQRQWWFLPGGHSIVPKAEIGVAYTATSHLHQGFSRHERGNRILRRLKGFVLGRHLISMNHRHGFYPV